MDPRGLAELVPIGKKTPDRISGNNDAAFVSRYECLEIAGHSPPLRNHGNYIVSLNKLVKWLGGLVEKAGVNLFTQFAGAQLIYEGNGISGVVTEDKGVDKDGNRKTTTRQATICERR